MPGKLNIPEPGNLEQLPESELEERLRRCAISEEEPDAEYISTLIHELHSREEPGDEPDVESALSDYFDIYAPRECRTARPGRRLTRIAEALAADVALVLFTTLAAQAAGYDLWGAVATWTRETFRFEFSGGEDRSEKLTREETAPEGRSGSLAQELAA